MKTLLAALFLIALVAHAEDPVRKAMLATFAHDVTKLDEAIRASPESVDLYSRRGDRHLFLGRPASAIADFEKMIALDPTQDAPHWRLGIAYHFAGAWQKSARQFEKYHAYDARDREYTGLVQP